MTRPRIPAFPFLACAMSRWVTPGPGARCCRPPAHPATTSACVPQVWQPITPLLQKTGLLNGTRWIAAAEEFPPQKLRRDFRAGIANSGVLLLAGAPTAGAEVLEAVERWIWPDGNPTWMFKWPFEQNALTQVVFRGYADRYTLLKPGCPINSPFGALIRHFVGGSPHRAIYHPDHRLPWLVDALRCTLHATAHSGAPEASPLKRCTPNERSIQLDVTGCAPHALLPPCDPGPRSSAVCAGSPPAFHPWQWGRASRPACLP